MTTPRDETALVEQLRAAESETNFSADLLHYNDLFCRAADALTAQAQEIAELREKVERLEREPRSLLRKAGELPQGCYCTDKCMAPVIQGRQTPCLRRPIEGAKP